MIAEDLKLQTIQKQLRTVPGFEWDNSSHVPSIVEMHRLQVFSLTSEHNLNLGTTHHSTLQMSWSCLELPRLELRSAFSSSLRKRFTTIGPGERMILASKLCHGTHQLKEPLHEPLVITCQS